MAYKQQFAVIPLVMVATALGGGSRAGAPTVVAIDARGVIALDPRGGARSCLDASDARRGAALGGTRLGTRFKMVPIVRMWGGGIPDPPTREQGTWMSLLRQLSGCGVALRLSPQAAAIIVRVLLRGRPIASTRPRRWGRNRVFAGDGARALWPVAEKRVAFLCSGR